MSVTIMTDCENVTIERNELGGLEITWNAPTGGNKIPERVYVNVECCVMVNEGHILVESTGYVSDDNMPIDDVKAK